MNYDTKKWGMETRLKVVFIYYYSCNGKSDVVE